MTKIDPGFFTRRGPADGLPEDKGERWGNAIIRELGIRHPLESRVQFRMRKQRHETPEEAELRSKLLDGCGDPRFVP